jgi:hypothetical protein
VHSHEMSKMNSTQPQEITKPWVKKHYLALITAAWFSAFILIYAPPFEWCFTWQRLFSALEYFTHGILIELYSSFPHTLSFLGPVVLIPPLGLVIGFAVEFLWKQGWPAKLIVVTVVVLNAG